jgi:hypothetical protein
MQVKSQVKMMMIKIGPMDFLLPHTHFIEHSVGAMEGWENPLQEYDESQENLSLRSSDSRTIPVSRTCCKSSEKMRQATETTWGTSKMIDVHKCENEGSWQRLLSRSPTPRRKPSSNKYLREEKCCVENTPSLAAAALNETGAQPG